jgi:hypothetical protein
MRVGVRLFCATLMAASLLPGLAFAQASLDVGDGKSKDKSPVAQQADERRNRRKEIDREYDAMRRNTQTDDKPVKVDPWAAMRSPNDNQKR